MVIKLIQYVKAKTHAGQDTCVFSRSPRVGFLHTRGIRLHFFVDVDEHLRNLRKSVGREKSRRRIGSNLWKTLILWIYWFFVDKVTPNLRKATFASRELGHCHYHTFKIVFSVFFGIFCVLLLALSYVLLSSRSRHFRHWTFCKSSSCLFFVRLLIALSFRHVRTKALRPKVFWCLSFQLCITFFMRLILKD